MSITVNSTPSRSSSSLSAPLHHHATSLPSSTSLPTPQAALPPRETTMTTAPKRTRLPPLIVPQMFPLSTSTRHPYHPATVTPLASSWPRIPTRAQSASLLGVKTLPMTSVQHLPVRLPQRPLTSHPDSTPSIPSFQTRHHRHLHSNEN